MMMDPTDHIAVMVIFAIKYRIAFHLAPSALRTEKTIANRVTVTIINALVKRRTIVRALLQMNACQEDAILRRSVLHVQEIMTARFVMLSRIRWNTISAKTKYVKMRMHNKFNPYATAHACFFSLSKFKCGPKSNTFELKKRRRVYGW